MLHSKAMGLLIFDDFQCFELDIVAFSRAFQKQSLLYGYYVDANSQFIATKMIVLAGKQFDTMPFTDTLQTLSDTLSHETEHRINDVIRDQHKIVCTTGSLCAAHMRPIAQLNVAENILLYTDSGLERYVHVQPCFVCNLLLNPVRAFDAETVEHVEMSINVSAEIDSANDDAVQACIIVVREGTPTIQSIRPSKHCSTSLMDVVNTHIETLKMCLSCSDLIAGVD